MAKTCPMLPPEINKEYNSLRKEYIDKGIPAEEANRQAASDMLAVIESITLGSSPNNQQQTNYQDVLNEVLEQKNIESIFNQMKDLGVKSDSESHSNHLSKVMKDMVYPLVDRLNGLAFNVKEGGNLTFGEFNEGSGINVFVTKNPNLNDLQMSTQEVATHEFIHAITFRLLKETDYITQKAIREIFNKAKATIKPSDLVEFVGSEEAAKEKWDYIFNTENGIYEFVAFGLTNEKFIQLLKDVKFTPKEAKPSNLKELLNSWFKRLLLWVNNKVLNLKEGNAYDALYKLSYDLAFLKTRNKNIVDYLSDFVEFNKDVGNKTIDLIIAPLAKLDTVKRGIQVYKGLQVANKTLGFGRKIIKVIDALTKHRQHFLLNMLSKLPQELVGMNVTNEAWHKLLRTSKAIVDGSRRRIKEATIQHVKESFKTPITDEEKNTLTASILRTGLDDLITNSSGEVVYTNNDLIGLFSDPSTLNQALEKEKTILSKFGSDVGNVFIKQALGLGKLLTDRNTFNHGNQMGNATQIASYEYYYPGYKRPNNYQEAIPSIERLKTLAAIKYLSSKDKAITAKVMEREFSANKEDNGINTLLFLNTNFKEQSLKDLFGGNPLLIRAGYTKEILDPSVMIRYSKDPNDKKLIDKGYVNKGKLSVAKKDPNKQDHYMYVSNYNGLIPYAKSIVSLTSRQAAGTSLTDIHVNDGSDYYAALLEAKNDTDQIKQSISKKEATSLNFDEKDVTNLIPLINDSGDIVNYRYEMSEETRKKILNRNDKVDQVLGYMYESLTDKVKSVDINNQVVDEIIKEHKTMYLDNPKEFITLTSDHPVYGEIFSLLPKEMKYELEKYFGKGNMVVREPMLNLIFGFRKYSVANKEVQGFIINTFKRVFALAGVTEGRFNTNLRKTEQGWQEFVQEIKTTIILKTHVLLYNIISNFIVSLMHGMPLNYMAKKQGEAVIAINDYVIKAREKTILEQKLTDKNLSKEARRAIEGKVNQLEVDLNNSSIKPLIDEGLLNSIVEDTNLDDEDFGIKNELIKAVVNKTKWIPKPVKTAYSYAYLTKDNKIFKFLDKTTRYSDFVARFALYEYYLKELKVPKDKALKIAIETFVNYDLPTSKELQYLNDMGLAMFTKYAIRIQKTLYRMVKDNPKSVIALHIGEQLFGEVSDPTDSFALIPGGPDNPLSMADELVAPGLQLLGTMLGFKVI